MLGVGWTEMLVIGVVALIVIGPKELPAVMHRLGKFTATIRRMGADFQRELNKTTGLNEITNLRNSVTAPLKATADAIRKEFNTTTATGQVQPSGVLKPADPNAESVVDEIKAAAGMAAPAVAAAPVAAAAEVAPVAAPAAKAPVKATRAPRVKVPVDKPVAVADIPPAKKPATRARKPIESPAPAEAIAPAKTAAKPKAATAKPVTAAKPKAAAKSVEAKPATAAKPKVAEAKAAPKAAAAKPKVAKAATQAAAAEPATKPAITRSKKPVSAKKS